MKPSEVNLGHVDDSEDHKRHQDSSASAGVPLPSTTLERHHDLRYVKVSFKLPFNGCSQDS